MEFDFDAAVVGAGAVGLACGYALARRGLAVVVLEKERSIGQGVSSRNSEVVHAGLYYPTGSLKARLCVEGRRALYPFLDSHKVAYEKCGKLVVASEPDQVERLDAILRQAEANDVEGVSLIGAAEATGLEPALRVEAALLSTQSGVFDSHGYMLALQGGIEALGGAVVTATPFEGATPLDGGGFTVRAGGAFPTTLTTRLLVTAPGLSAQGVAGAVEGFPRERIPALHFGKGVYFRLRGRAPFDRLIYPPPIPGALGTHYRKDLGGQAVFGPDLAYVDTEDYTVDPARAETFYTYIRKFWPGLPDGSLDPDYAGLRPKIHGPGEPQPDFRLDGAEVHGLPGLMALFGIESPGLTSSLAIGERVAARLMEEEAGDEESGAKDRA
jgi:L-2-hydroxyglutarate oxidase LhgO